MQSQHRSHSPTRKEKKERRGSTEFPAVFGASTIRHPGHGFVDLEEDDSFETSSHAGVFGTSKKKIPGHRFIKLEEDDSFETQWRPTKMSSAEKLTKLAVPKTFEGPEVRLQGKIVEVLERRIQEQITKKLGEENKDNPRKRANEEGAYASAHFVGAIELTKSPKDDLGKLIRGAKLINLPRVANTGPARVEGHALGTSSLFDLVGGIENDIIRNTLSTMESAGQLDYLRESGLINDDWKVVVEVHYYRDRDVNMTGLHKDTLGQTLFVNLNFQNNEEIAGPEFIINPASPKEYDSVVSNSLPVGFIDDLNKAKSQFPEPEWFGASRIPKNGVVAFVDEAIHHKTPMLQHRKVSVKRVEEVLQKKYSAMYKDAQQAYGKYILDNEPTTFSSSLAIINRKNAGTWLNLMTKINTPDGKVDRTELAKILSERHINKLIEGQTQWGSVNAPDFDQFGAAKSPTFKDRMVVTSKPLLKRQMSQYLLEDDAPKPAQGRRTFFRTWVRAVPTLNNRMHTVLCSDIADQNPEVKQGFEEYKKQGWFGKKKPFTDYIPPAYHHTANVWLDIMEKSRDKHARFYTAGVPKVGKM